MTVVRPGVDPRLHWARGPASTPPDGDPSDPPPAPPPQRPARAWPPLWRLLRRLPGGVLFLLSPALLLLSPLMVLYSLARSARLVAWHLFQRGEGTVGPHDPAVARVKTLRTWVAVAVSVAVLAASGNFDDVSGLVEDRWLALLATPWLLIASGPAVFAVLFWCAPSERRRAMRGALRTPLRQLAWFVGSLLLAPALIVGFAVAEPSRVGGSLAGWLSLAWVAACVWAAFLFLFASAAVARTGFGSATVHRTAPALLTTVLVWEFAAISGLPPGPLGVEYVFLIGGPITVTAITWWEHHRLRTYHGVTIRHG